MALSVASANGHDQESGMHQMRSREAPAAADLHWPMVLDPMAEISVVGLSYQRWFAVFEKMMPGYLSVLESNLTARDLRLSKRARFKGGRGLLDCILIQLGPADSDSGSALHWS